VCGPGPQINLSPIRGLFILVEKRVLHYKIGPKAMLFDKTRAEEHKI
jgi:hypothetical protein